MSAMKKIQLRQICHARAGDKGDTLNIGLIVYDRKDYELVRRQVTAQRVKEFFKEIVKGDVKRYELPQLGALNFVLHNALDGGLSRSIRLDPFGKSLSAFLLSLEIEKSDQEMTDKDYDYRIRVK